jgi:hypothetical protein
VGRNESRAKLTTVEPETESDIETLDAISNDVKNGGECNFNASVFVTPVEESKIEKSLNNAELNNRFGTPGHLEFLYASNKRR